MPRLLRLTLPFAAVLVLWGATGCGAGDVRGADKRVAQIRRDVEQRVERALYDGVVQGLPGQRAGYGRAAGDFAVAYVLAHEYGHNIQQELGIFDNRATPSAEPYELQADCFAGTWANSVYRQGHLEPGDLEEATNAALGRRLRHGQRPAPREPRAAP